MNVNKLTLIIRFTQAITHHSHHKSSLSNRLEKQLLKNFRNFQLTCNIKAPVARLCDYNSNCVTLFITDESVCFEVKQMTSLFRIKNNIFNAMFVVSFEVFSLNLHPVFPSSVCCDYMFSWQWASEQSLS